MTTQANQFPLLSEIHSPQDLRLLRKEQLPKLAKECREYLYQTLNECGGHFGASLGATEITIALHYLFNTPTDKIIYDVGHQAYVHKILTERREQLSTIRQDNGLTPFPTRKESDYDAFGVGHSSTSISAALGMATAFNLDNADSQAIAVIGDGAMTAGMAFEALNHAGAIDANLLVVLNDNDMSISRNVGAMSNYFARILSSSIYTTLREGGKKVLGHAPEKMQHLVKRTEVGVKDMLTDQITPGTLFEELGFHYFGPIDGHDLPTLLAMLENLKQQTGPRLLHIITSKGKGFAPAEADPVKYHYVSPGFYQPKENTISVVKPKPLTYSNVFGQWLCDMAAIDERLVGITPAMREGSDLVAFSEKFPNRYFDVGIAEQHSVTFAAGLACQGKKPVVAIYSTFLQRAYDQLIHDVALQNLPVVFALDRAGLVGGDGPTHAGSFDLSYCRTIPNMVIMAPSDENETRQCLYTAYQHDGPTVVRYPRGAGTGAAIDPIMQAYPIGKANLKRQGKNIAILAFGAMLAPSLEAAEKLDATVVDMRFVKPLDEALISTLANTHELLVTVEENALMGGAGSAVSEYLHANNQLSPLLQLGLPDSFIDHGNPKTMLANCGLDAKGIYASIKEKQRIYSDKLA